MILWQEDAYVYLNNAVISAPLANPFDVTDAQRLILTITWSGPSANLPTGSVRLAVPAVGSGSATSATTPALSLPVRAVVGAAIDNSGVVSLNALTGSAMIVWDTLPRYVILDCSLATDLHVPLRVDVYAV